MSAVTLSIWHVFWVGPTAQMPSFPTVEENFLNGTQDKHSAPRREPAAIQAITCVCGKAASRYSHEGFELLTLASLAPCSSQVR